MTEPASAPAPPTRARLGLVFLLGTLTIMAPLSIDMYLSALPTIAQAFGVGPGDAQLTLMSYFLGFALGQAFYGPVVDRFGRKPPLYFGIGLFAVVSLCCAFAPTIQALIILRFLQALGACAGSVVSRAVVRDLFAPSEGSRVFAMLALVTGMGPLLGPLIGGYILIAFGWRAIFVMLFAVAIVLLAIVRFRLTETHRPTASIEARAQAFKIGRIVSGYWRLLNDRRYIGFALCSAFPLAGMFVYVTGAPFVIIGLYNVPPQYFGWVFGANAIVLIAGSQVNGRIVGRIPPATLLRRGTLAQFCAGLLLLAHGLTGWGGLAGFLVPLALYTSCMGFIMPNAMVLAMAPFGPIAGMASALMGTTQFVLGALAASVMSTFQGATALATTAGMAFFAASGFLTYRFVVRADDKA